MQVRCLAQEAGMGAHSAPEPGLDAYDSDSGWDLIGDLREALPDTATNGGAAGAKELASTAEEAPKMAPEINGTPASAERKVEESLVAAATPADSPRAEFDLADFVEAEIASVEKTKDGASISLKLQDGRGSIVRVYVGNFEGTALEYKLQNTKMARPLTHDLFRNCLELLGCKVVRVLAIAAFEGNTFLARLHLAAPGGSELELDARPSDAINLAARTGAPLFVRRDVAGRVARHQ
ncbi:hypothetical protein WJX81_004583 [Elliptochloris bilobata]|uniref:BFN domain-containing protein n=1 Tax=Elliptochloris bilobata TaxID=381761 RepID=A0AAW1RZN0_9CHLO